MCTVANRVVGPCCPIPRDIWITMNTSYLIERQQAGLARLVELHQRLDIQIPGRAGILELGEVLAERSLACRVIDRNLHTCDGIRSCSGLDEEESQQRHEDV